MRVRCLRPRLVVKRLLVDLQHEFTIHTANFGDEGRLGDFFSGLRFLPGESLTDMVKRITKNYQAVNHAVLPFNAQLQGLGLSIFSDDANDICHVRTCSD